MDCLFILLVLDIFGYLCQIAPELSLFECSASDAGCITCHYYYVSLDMKKAWKDSLTCTSIGGNLVSIADEIEYEHLKKSPDLCWSYWIGLSARNESEKFVLSGNSSSSFFKWQSCKPGINSTSECLMKIVEMSLKVNSKLTEKVHNLTNYLICKVPAKTAVVNRSCTPCDAIVNTKLEPSVLRGTTENGTLAWNVLNKATKVMLSVLVYLSSAENLPVCVVGNSQQLILEELGIFTVLIEFNSTKTKINTSFVLMMTPSAAAIRLSLLNQSEDSLYQLQEVYFLLDISHFLLEPVRYTFDFGDKTAMEMESGLQNSSRVILFNRFLCPGTYEVTVTAYFKAYLLQSSFQVKIKPWLQICLFPSPAIVSGIQLHRLNTALVSFPPKWRCIWSFGGSSTPSVVHGSNVAKKIYTRAGKYKVTVKLETYKGTLLKEDTVNVFAPVLSVDVKLDTGNLPSLNRPLTFRVDATGSHLSFTWTTSDGSAEILNVKANRITIYGKRSGWSSVQVNVSNAISSKCTTEHFFVAQELNRFQVYVIPPGIKFVGQSVKLSMSSSGGTNVYYLIQYRGNNLRIKRHSSNASMVKDIVFFQPGSHPVNVTILTKNRTLFCNEYSPTECSKSIVINVTFKITALRSFAFHKNATNVPNHVMTKHNFTIKIIAVGGYDTVFHLDLNNRKIASGIKGTWNSSLQSSIAVIQLSIEKPGVYTVLCKVNNNVSTLSYSYKISVLERVTPFELVISPTILIVHQPFRLKAKNQLGTNVTYMWHFDDHNSIRETVAPDMTYRYSSPGTFNVTVVVRNLLGDVVNFTLVKVLESIHNAFSKVLINIPKTVQVGKEFPVQFYVLQGSLVNADIDFGDGYHASLKNMSQSESIHHYYPSEGIYNVSTSISNSFSRNISFNKVIKVMPTNSGLTFSHLNSSVEPITGFMLNYPNYTMWRKYTNITYSFITGLPLTITFNFGDGSSTKISPKGRSGFALKLYHQREGLYNWNVKVENDVSPVLSYNGVIDVQMPVPYIEWQITPNQREKCIPVGIKVQAIGFSPCQTCKCLFKVGQVVVRQGAVTHNYYKTNVFDCKIDMAITRTGDQTMRLKVYNEVSYNERVHPLTAYPVLADSGPFRIFLDAPRVPKGKATRLRVYGNAVCPEVYCTINFGDGTADVVGMVRPNSTVSHIYSSVGSYNISARCTLKSYNDTATTIALVEAGFLITSLTKTSHCILFGQSYFVNVSISKIVPHLKWHVLLNDIKVSDASSVVTTSGKNSTIEIPVSVYVRSGDHKLLIDLISYDRYHILNTTMCIQDKIINFTVIGPDLSKVGDVVVFQLDCDIYGDLYLEFKFGDGGTLWRNFTQQFQKTLITYTYTNAGRFKYAWIVENKFSRLNGSSLIRIFYPIKGLRSSPNIVLEWPQSTVPFKLIHNVSYNPPSDAQFMIEFGNGEVSDWLNLNFIKKDEEVFLLNHKYTELNCFSTRIIVKNAVDYVAYAMEVNVLDKIRSISLELQNNNQLKAVRQSGSLYLKTEHAIHAKASVDFQKCVEYQWRVYNDKSTFFMTITKVNTIDINNLIGKIGRYFVRVNVVHALSNITTERVFHLEESLSGLELLSSKPHADGVVNFTVLAEKPGTGTLFSWDFGDGWLLNETVATFQPTDYLLPHITSLEGANKLNLSKYQAYVRSHKYLTKGLKTVTLIAKDSFTALKASRTVFFSKDIFCGRPEVGILKQGADSLIFNADESFIILSQVKLECGSYRTAVFLWELYTSSPYLKSKGRLAESDKQISFPKSIDYNQREISFSGRSLRPGIYIVKLTVILRSLGYSESDQSYLEIQEVPLEVTITGGSSRILPWDEDLILDSSSSYDPNVSEEQTHKLSFAWSCRVKEGELNSQLRARGCAFNGGTIDGPYDAIWNIPAKQLLQNIKLVFTVNVSNNEIDSRKSSATQIVLLETGKVLKTVISCQSNCRLRINPLARLVVMGRCTECGLYLSYNWTLFSGSDSTEITLNWLKDTLTPRDASSFVLIKGVLERSKRYTAKLSITSIWGGQGFAEYSFSVSTPPWDGLCDINPKTGKAVDTTFTVSCTGWKGESSTLQYHFLMISNQVSSTDLDTKLLSFGPSSEAKFTLPAGKEERNNTQRLLVRITDSYGATSEVSLTVQVKQFSVTKPEDKKKEFITIEDALSARVMGNDSKLTIISGLGDVQSLSSFCGAVSKALDTAQEVASSGNVTKNEKDKRLAKRKEIRESIVTSLTEVKLTNLNNFAVVTNALAAVSSSEEEIKSESQDKMLSFITSASSFLSSSSRTWKKHDPEEIQSAVNGFLASVGNLLDSVTLSSSKQDKQENRHETFTMRSLKIIENSTGLLLNTLVPDEAPRRTKDDSMIVELRRSDSSRLNSMNITTMKHGTLTTPSGHVLLGNSSSNASVTDVKMVSLAKNPFMWDRDKVGSVITPTISSLKLVSGDKRMEIKNLSKGNEIVIEILTPSTPVIQLKNLNGTWNKLTFVRVTQPTPGAVLFLKASCMMYGCPGMIYVKYGTLPTTSKFDQICNITDNFCLSSNPNPTKENLSNQSFYLGFFFNSAGSRNESVLDNHVNFSLQLFSSSCLYWNTTSSRWSSDGCQVSSRSTPQKTVCLCNHLTWFGGGLLVAPNALNIENELLKLKRLYEYPALLATVCTVIGFYVLAIIWARKRDKKDTGKVSLLIAPCCCRTHNYRYDVTFYTGQRPGSGTTANVYFILGGKEGHTDPVALMQEAYPRPIFERGSVETFLVTSSEDLGDIEYIDIWHDNEGESPSWFLSRVTVRDMLQGGRTHLLCRSWFAIDRDDGQIKRMVTAATDKEMKNFQTLFFTRSSKDFSDNHLWFSVAMRPARSNFTRVQRVSCCLCALLCTMLANAMFYKREETVAGANVNLGSFKFNYRQIIIGIEASLIVIPVNLLLVQIFRKAATKPKIGPQSKDSWSSLASSIDRKTKIRKKRTAKEFDSIIFRATSVMSENTPVGADDMAKENVAAKTETANEISDPKTRLTSSQSGTENASVKVLECPEESLTYSNSRGEAQICSGDQRFTVSVCSDCWTQASNEASAGQGSLRSYFWSEFKKTGTVHCYCPDKVVLNIESDEEPTKEIAHATLLVCDDQNKTAQEESKKDKDPDKDIGAESSWPHWCRYIGWSLCICTSLIAGFFTLLYGISFGKKGQEEWLVSFFTSVFQDVFISQTAKVVLIAAFFAYALKKFAVVDEPLPEVELAKNDEWALHNLPDQTVNSNNMKYQPMTAELLKNAREKKMLQLEMADVTLEIIIYLIYILIALLIAYGHRHPDAYKITSNIEAIFVRGKFDNISSVSKFWNWTDKILIPGLYNEKWYNGDAVRSTGFLSDHASYLIGSPRLRQLRVKKEPCDVDSSGLWKRGCGKKYSSSNEDTSNGYSIGWMKGNSSYESLLGDSPWKYHTATELRGHPFIAQIALYGGGGFVQNLGKTASSAKTTLDSLKSSLWIDKFSRALFIEFTTYNNNGNFYCMVTLLVELPASGGVFPVHQIVTTRLDRYISEFSLFIGSCEVVFLLLTVYYMYLELKRFRKQGTLYFYKRRNITELLSFALTWASFGLLIVRLGIVKWTKNNFRANPAAFVNFQYAGVADLLYGQVLAAVVFIAFLKMLTILRFNKNIFILFQTLSYASKDLTCFFIYFWIILTAYVCWGHLTFLCFLQGYHNFVSSTVSSLNILLGSFDFQNFVTANRVIGPLFFCLFILTMVFITTNMFLTIVIEAFKMTKSKIRGKKQNKYDIIDYIWGKIRQFIPCLLQSSIPYTVEGGLRTVFLQEDKSEDNSDAAKGLPLPQEYRPKDESNFLLSKADGIEEGIGQLGDQINALDKMVDKMDVKELKGYKCLLRILLKLNTADFWTERKET